MKKSRIIAAGILTCSMAYAAAPVELVAVQKKDVRITTTQPVSAEAYHTASIGPRVSGYVSTVLVDIGSLVKAGQAMVEIDAPELEAAVEVLKAETKERTAAIAAAQADLSAAESEQQRVSALAAKGSITEKAAHEAQQRQEQAKAALLSAEASKTVTEARLIEARQMMEYTSIPAPFDGIVSVRNVDPGDLVSADSDLILIQVAAITPLRVVTFIPEREAVWLNNGDKAVLSFDAYPGQTFEATISRTSGVLDSKTRRMRAEIDLDNSKGLLFPGMYGKAQVELKNRRNALVLPAGSVRLNDGAPHVYAIENGAIKRMPVTTGNDTGTEIEILSGLTGSEQIVANSIGRLRDGDAVSVKARN